MIRDFDTVKQQLSELAEVVNKFKSETVQLKIVELVLGGAKSVETADEPEGIELKETPVKRRKARRKTRAPKTESSDTAVSAPRIRRSGKGPLANLTELADSGYFDKPRTMNEIISYCDEKLVLKYKSSDLSPTLGRMVKNNTLDRSKNGEGQYEYTKR
jgi:hypothetical protein